MSSPSLHTHSPLIFDYLFCFCQEGIAEQGHPSIVQPMTYVLSVEPPQNKSLLCCSGAVLSLSYSVINIVSGKEPTPGRETLQMLTLIIISRMRRVLLFFLPSTASSTPTPHPPPPFPAFALFYCRTKAGVAA